MNLLPEENKIAYKQLYLKRLVVVFGTFVFFIAVSGVIVLTPCLLLILSYKNELTAERDYFLKKDAISAGELIATEIKKLNERSKFAEASKNKISPVGIFKKIIDEKGDNIKINSFSYEKGAVASDEKKDAKNEDKIALSGIARKRDDLIAFENRLKEQFGNDKVVSPVSNLINGKNSVFSIFLYVKN